MKSAKDINEQEFLAIINAYWAAVRAGEEPEMVMPYKVWVARGFPEKVVYAKYDKMMRKGYLEYGVSLRTAWLSEKGEDRLAELLRKSL